MRFQILSICNVVPKNKTHLETIKIKSDVHGNVYVNVNRDTHNGRDSACTLLETKSLFLCSGNKMIYSHIKGVFKMNNQFQLFTMNYLIICQELSITK